LRQERGEAYPGKKTDTMTQVLKRIYIIDDDPGISHYLSILLKETGWAEPQVFNDPFHGLEACLKSPPDCLVLDLELPHLRGEEICRILRSSSQRRFFHIPIIIISHLPDARRREMEMLELGADAYFEKPFDGDLFLNKILIHTTLIETEDTGKRASAPLDASSSQTKHIYFHGYEILEKIGGGGMGTVYKARQKSLDRMVALKVLSPQMRGDPSLYMRFEREAKVLAQINHPHIVQIYDVGLSTYAPYFVMEFVEGTNLYRKIREKTLTIPDCLGIIKQTSDALIYLHSRSIIHRDFKPSNILISLDGAAKLTDFGVCRVRLPRDIAELTKVSTIMGTPSYIAPEMIKGESASESSDQFSFGMTVLNMLSTKPFELSENSLKFLRQDLPGNLAPILEKCLRESPQDRFPSIREARDAVLQSLAQASPGSLIN